MQQFRGFQGTGRLACIGLMLLVSACSRSDPEQALRGEFALMQQAIEQRKAGAVADFLAPDFIGNDAMDRDDARRLAAAMFLRNSQVAVATGPLQLRLRGQEPLQFPLPLPSGVQFSLGLGIGSTVLRCSPLRVYT